MPKRGDRVAPPPGPAEWDVRFGDTYKGKRADLEAAYKQLLDYREDLENPPPPSRRSDIERIEIHTNC